MSRKLIIFAPLGLAFSLLTTGFLFLNTSPVQADPLPLVHLSGNNHQLVLTSSVEISQTTIQVRWGVANVGEISDTVPFSGTQSVIVPPTGTAAISMDDPRFIFTSTTPGLINTGWEWWDLPRTVVFLSGDSSQIFITSTTPISTSIPLTYGVSGLPEQPGNISISGTIGSVTPPSGTVSLVPNDFSLSYTSTSWTPLQWGWWQVPTAPIAVTPTITVGINTTNMVLLASQDLVWGFTGCTSKGICISPLIDLKAGGAQTVTVNGFQSFNYPNPNGWALVFSNSAPTSWDCANGTCTKVAPRRYQIFLPFIARGCSYLGQAPSCPITVADGRHLTSDNPNGKLYFAAGVHVQGWHVTIGEQIFTDANFCAVTEPGFTEGGVVNGNEEERRNCK